MKTPFQNAYILENQIASCQTYALHYYHDLPWHLGDFHNNASYTEMLQSALKYAGHISKNWVRFSIIRLHFYLYFNYLVVLYKIMAIINFCI